MGQMQNITEPIQQQATLTSSSTIAAHNSAFKLKQQRIKHAWYRATSSGWLLLTDAFILHTTTTLLSMKKS